MPFFSGFLRRFFRILQLLACVGILLGFVLVAAVTFVVAKFDGDAAFPADCAIVFGTAVRATIDTGHGTYSTPGPGILRRVGEAASLYKQGKVRHLFLSGGKGESMQQSEAAVMRRIAIQDGVPAADITVEDQSHSTWQNLRFTRPLTKGCASVIGISDRYHLARIEVLASLMGWKLRTYPAEQTAGWQFETESVIREAFGILLAPVNSLLT